MRTFPRWATRPLVDHLSSADVIHPAPGAEGRPSFTALVANVDSDTAKYVADCRVQTSRQELIEDLESMSQVRTPVPRVDVGTNVDAADAGVLHGLSREGGEEV